jgi:hypothetical protein
MTSNRKRTHTTACAALALGALAAATAVGAVARWIVAGSRLPAPRNLDAVVAWWSSQPVLDHLGQLGSIGVAGALGSLMVVLLDTSRLALLATVRGEVRDRDRTGTAAPPRGLRSSRALAAMLTASTGALSLTAPPVGAATDSGATATTSADSATAPTADLVEAAAPDAADPTTTTTSASSSTGTGSTATAPSATAPTSAATAAPTDTAGPGVPINGGPTPSQPDPAPAQRGGPRVAGDPVTGAAPTPGPAWTRPASMAGAERAAAASTGPLGEQRSGPTDRDVPPAAGADSEREVTDGDSFWSIAADEVGRSLGRPPLDREVAGYWNGLIEANRGRLPDPSDPDLIVPGMRLAVPPVTMPDVMPGR